VLWWLGGFFCSALVFFSTFNGACFAVIGFSTFVEVIWDCCQYHGRARTS
jgi:hypothetical protein